MISNTFTKTIARFALPVAAAGMIGGAALGLAGAANATTSTQPSGPGYSYAPEVKAHPAPSAPTGLHGAARSQYFQNAYNH
jgi:ABC-type phosphate transport system permease subunit